MVKVLKFVLLCEAPKWEVVVGEILKIKGSRKAMGSRRGNAWNLLKDEGNVRKSRGSKVEQKLEDGAIALSFNQRKGCVKSERGKERWRNWMIQGVSSVLRYS